MKFQIYEPVIGLEIHAQLLAIKDIPFPIITKN